MSHNNAELISELNALLDPPADSSNKKRKANLLKKHDYHIAAADGTARQLTSWRMSDFAYKQSPCPFPTRARGLFTEGSDQIIVRGYDKFFNVNEVSWTKVSYCFCFMNVTLISAPVGEHIEAFDWTISFDSQVERVHYLHGSIVSRRAAGYFKACLG